MSKSKTIPPTSKGSVMRGSPFFQSPPEPPRTNALSPDVWTQHPATREPLAKPVPQTGAANLAPEPAPKQTFRNSLGPDPMQAAPAPSNPRPASKDPFADLSGGGLVSDPFRPVDR
jgi:hypothetical protein